MTLGQRIKELRERKGLTQSGLARQCGIAQATISRLESGDLQEGAFLLERHLKSLDVCFITTLPAAVGAQHAAPLLPEG